MDDKSLEYIKINNNKFKVNKGDIMERIDSMVTDIALKAQNTIGIKEGDCVPELYVALAEAEHNLQNAIADVLEWQIRTKEDEGKEILHGLSILQMGSRKKNHNLSEEDINLFLKLISSYKLITGDNLSESTLLYNLTLGKSANMVEELTKVKNKDAFKFSMDLIKTVFYKVELPYYKAMAESYFKLTSENITIAVKEADFYIGRILLEVCDNVINEVFYIFIFDGVLYSIDRHDLVDDYLQSHRELLSEKEVELFVKFYENFEKQYYSYESV